MKRLCRCIILAIGFFTVATTTSCHKRTPYVFADAGLVKCEVTKTDFGQITGVKVQSHVATNMYQELYVFDTSQKMNEKKATSLLYHPSLVAERPRETWIGVNAKWDKVILKIRHPDGGEYFLVIQNPPLTSQVSSNLVLTSILTTDPSKVLHEQAKSLITRAD